jgi:hypothetical protein
MHWGNKIDVSLLLTVHSSETVEVQGLREVKRKLQAVVEYIHTVGVVDRVIYNLTNYPVIRKRGKNSTKRYFPTSSVKRFWKSNVLCSENGRLKNQLNSGLNWQNS